MYRRSFRVIFFFAARYRSAEVVRFELGGGVRRSHDDLEGVLERSQAKSRRCVRWSL